MTFLELLICVTIAVAGLTLLQYEARWLRKLGMLFLFGTTVLGLTFAFQHIALALAISLLMWVVYPLSEIILVLRRLRVPRVRTLRDAKPPLDDTGTLSGLNADMTSLGFSKVDDCELTPELHHQYYRLFIHDELPIHSLIGWVTSEDFGFHFTSFYSEDTSGHLWMTWDYPLTWGLKTPPGVSLYRADHAETVDDLLQAHLDFLELNERLSSTLVRSDVTREAARSRLEAILRQQLEYNVELGILAPVLSSAGAPSSSASQSTGKPESQNGEAVPATSPLSSPAATSGQPEPTDFRYSWRGTFYVAAQVLRDLVRL
ncbi:MAG: hypothetical protein ACAI35_28405 [Candidatus Methylacidiphilales bacterium]|nr:hypothetical protein [Candidatus Methylacidiphilales bacterium]